MNIKYYGQGSSKKVLSLEKSFRIKLPEDYKNFLIQHNGGVVTDGCLYVKELDEYMLMGYFFGTGIKKGVSDIIKINEEFYDDIPKKSLLIGEDEGSGFLLLINDGENDGIWYYDHTYFFKKSNDNLNTYYICETFSDFIKHLEATTLPEEH